MALIMNCCFKFSSFPKKVKLTICCGHDLSYIEPPQPWQLYELHSHQTTYYTHPDNEMQIRQKRFCNKFGRPPKVRFHQFSQQRKRADFESTINLVPAIFRIYDLRNDVLSKAVSEDCSVAVGRRLQTLAQARPPLSHYLHTAMAAFN